MRKLTDEQINDIASCVCPEDLPGDLPDIADTIGVFKALKLAHEIGGSCVYLARWNADNPSEELKRYIDIIGQKDAKTVALLFNGTHVMIPKCEALFKKVEHKIIIEKLGSKSGTQVAREHKLSERHIRRIKSKAMNDDRQMDLFCNADDE